MSYWPRFDLVLSLVEKALPSKVGDVGEERPDCPLLCCHVKKEKSLKRCCQLPVFSSQYARLMWCILKSKRSVSLNTLSGLSFSEDFNAEASNSVGSEGAHQRARAVRHHVGAIAQLGCLEFHATYTSKCPSACWRSCPCACTLHRMAMKQPCRATTVVRCSQPSNFSKEKNKVFWLYLILVLHRHKCQYDLFHLGVYSSQLNYV